MERKVYFYSSPGLRLAGVLELPDEGGKSARRPGIVLCHAGTGTKEVLLPEVSKWLVRKGYVETKKDNHHTDSKKVFYHVTDTGKKALQECRSVQESLWAALPDKALI